MAFNFKSVQLELGSTATPYEPYTESTQYINAPKLRSLPNGVRDEIRPDGRGGHELVQRVEKHIVQSSEVYNGGAFNGIVRVFIKGFTNTNWDNYLNNNSRLGELKEVGNDATGLKVGNEKKVYATNARQHVVVPFEIGTELDEMKNFLRGMEFHYQLAEPIITPLYPSGNLITQSSGTVYIEDVVADVATYSASALIGRSELLIKELDQLSVMDFETGGERKLDVSKAVVSTDKLSFTHPDLSNGDIVFFEYYYTEESTDGLASVEYFDSRYTIKDSVTDKHYKWSISIADGVPKIDLEEV